MKPSQREPITQRLVGPVSGHVTEKFLLPFGTSICIGHFSTRQGRLLLLLFLRDPHPNSYFIFLSS